MYGENDAKQAILDITDKLEEKAQKIVKELENGKAGDIQTISKAIALLVEGDSIKTRMIRPLFMANLVTVEECKMRHTEIEHKKALKLKLGPVAIEGNFSSISILIIMMVLCSGGLIVVIGKAAQLW